jgi:hypothetical protein
MKNPVAYLRNIYGLLSLTLAYVHMLMLEQTEEIPTPAPLVNTKAHS